ncbi:MAG: TolC family protein, partial [Betaproteobacteria bacterium]|nr:TolC family protein [Betaproteobacteria bacterium]
MRGLALALAASFAAALLAGCAVGPDYVRPVLTTPETWRIDYPQAADVANTRWWEKLGDPVLNQLIDEALRENRDVRIAAARVEGFLGALASTRSQFFPQIGYGADASRNKASRAGATPIPA